MKAMPIIRFAFILLCCISIIPNAKAQQVDFRSPLNNASTLTIRGEMQLIGNAITGLDGFQPGGVPGISTFIDYDPNQPYNGGSYNDLLTQGYIDIDGDPDTFSSSSATFSINNSNDPNDFDCSTIAYAGLYWTATYYTRKNNDNSPQLVDLPTADDRPDFRTIKLMRPGTGAYIDVTAEAGTEGTIFDGWRDTATNQSAIASNDVPYVCYADVTTQLQELNSPTGEYTVANVRSAIGETARGSGISSGWMLVIIYENQQSTEKFFSTRHGYLEISGSSPEEFEYTGFQTLPAPNPIRARFGVAALEGDFGIPGDGLSIVGGVPAALTALPVNQATNFFNSSISVDGQYLPGRTPNSDNTLGFDVDIFDINNPGNNVIGNNQQQVDFRATTSGDRYRIFFNAFSVEVIAPDLLVDKKVLKDNENITGGTDPVDLGDQLFYELTLENIGNENLTNTVITDQLSANIDFIPNSFVLPNGVTANYDAGNRTITFTVDDSVIEIDDGPISIRFGIQVVNSCADIRDACSNEIRNTAFSTYTGVLSGTTVPNQPSVLGIDACNEREEGSADVLISLESCDEPLTAFLCPGGSVDLVAGTGFSNYVWRDGNGTIISSGPSNVITVTETGNYSVDKSGNPDCTELLENWTVDSYTTGGNPFVAIANDPDVNGNIRECPVTGEDFPEFFLCGSDDTLYLDSGFAAAESIIWQRLDPAACPTVDRNPACPTEDAACEPLWEDLASSRDYTVSIAGEYRILVTFDGGCVEDYYFNVYKNNFDPELRIIKEIICGEPGSLEVTNSSSQYEHQLVYPDGTTSAYQVSPIFTGLTEGGNYTVNVRLINDFPSPCIYEASINMDELESIVDITAEDPLCPDQTGRVIINITSSEANYIYTISSDTTGFSASEGPTADPSHVFEGLNPDTYTVEVSSYDGDCFASESVTVGEPDEFTATATLERDLSCNPNYQPNPDLNDPNHPDYDPTAPPYDPDEFIALIRVTVTGGSGDFTFSISNPFELLEPEVGSTYLIRFTTDGTYQITVTDNVSSCSVDTGEVIINPYVPLQASAQPISPLCANGLGSIEVTVTAGEGPYTYTLDLGEPGTQTTTTTSNTHIFNNVATGDHTIDITDTFGCPIDQISVRLDNANQITADIAITEDFRCTDTGDPFIAGEITVSNPSGGNGIYQYSIDGVTFTINNVFGGLTAGTYTLFIRDTQTIDCPVNLGQLTIDPLQEVTDLEFDLSDLLCPDLRATLTITNTVATNGATDFEYRITPPAANVFGTDTSFSVEAGVIYTIEARTTTDGCIYSETFAVPDIEPIGVIAQLGSEPACYNGTDGTLNFTVTNIDLTSNTYSYEVSAPSLPTPRTGSGINTTPIVIDNLQSDTYTITVTDDTTNCIATTSVTIDNPEDVNATAVATLANCDQSTGTITVTADGGRGNFQYELRDGTDTNVIRPFQNSNIFNGLAAGNYTVNVRDVFGTEVCPTNPIPIQVEEVTPLQIVGNTIDPCYTNDDPASREYTITDSPNSTVPPTYEYSLDGNIPVNITGNTFTINDLTPGTHTVTVTNTATNCSVEDTFDINEELEITASLTADLRCNTAAEISFSAVGGTGTYTFDLIRVDVTPNVETNGITSPVQVPDAGTYQIRVRDNNTPACEDLSQEIIIQPALPPTATIDTVDILCFGEATGVITITPSGGTAPYLTRITDSGIAGYDTFSPNNIYNNLPAGTYTVEVQDDKGCIEDFSVTINQNPEITLSVTSDPVQCTGDPNDANNGFILGTIRVTATNGSGNYIFTLYNLDGTINTDTTSPNPSGIVATSSYNFDGLSSQEYFVTVEDANGCIKEQDIEVGSPTSDLSIIPVPIQSDCSSGLTLDIAIEGGVNTYEIQILGPNIAPGFNPTNAQATQFPPGFTPDPLGVAGGNHHRATGLLYNVQYIIEINDGTNCIFRERIQLPEDNPDAPEVDITKTDDPCRNGIDEGRISAVISGLPTGTDIEWRLFNFNTGIELPGFAGTTTMTSSPFTLDGTVFPLFDQMPNGRYYLTVAATATPFCTGEDRFRIRQPSQELELNLQSKTDQNCENNAQVAVIAIGGTAPYTYSVTLQGDPTVIDTNTTGLFDLTDTTGTGTIYTVTVVDDLGICTQTLDVTINSIPEPEFTSVTFNDQCDFDNDYQIVVTATGASTLEFGIDDGDTSTNDIPSYATGTLVTGTTDTYTFTYNVTTPSVDEYTLTVRDEIGCIDTATISVYPALLIDAEFTVEPTCGNLGEITATVTGGSGDATNWTVTLTNTGTNTQVGQLNTPSTAPNEYVFIDIEPGTYEVSVVDSTNPLDNCDPETVTLSRPDSENPVITITPTAETCVDADNGSILVNLDPASATDPPYTFELYIGATITGTPLVSQVDDPFFDSLAPGTYSVRVVSAISCEETLLDIEIEEATPVTADINDSGYSCTGDVENFPVITINNIAGGTGTYTIGYTGPTVTVTPQTPDELDTDNDLTNGVQIIAVESGTYTIQIFDGNNCPNDFTHVVDPFQIMTDSSVDTVAPIDCNTNIEQVTVSVTGGTGPFNIVEVNNPAISQTNIPAGAGGTTTSGTFDLPSPGVYIFEITDQATGCSILTDPYTVDPYDTIRADISIRDNILCASDTNGVIELVVTGYDGNYSYTVTNTVTSDDVSTGNSTTADNPTEIGNLSPGSYSVTVVATDTPFCDATSNVIILVAPTQLNLDVTQLERETCDPGDDASILATGTGGTAPFQYQLEQPAGTVQVAFDANGTFDGLDAGTYTVRIQDANGCEQTEDIEILAPTGTTITATISNELDCHDSLDGEITAVAAGGQGVGSYIFSITKPDGSTSQPDLSATDSYTFIGLGPGIHTVTVTDDLNCSATIDVELIAPDELELTVETIREPNCTERSADIQVLATGGTAPYTYSIDGTTFVAGDTFTGLTNGNYEFYVQDANGCIAGPSNTIPVMVPEDLVATPVNTNIVCFGEPTGSVDATVTGGLGNNQYYISGTTYLGDTIRIPETNGTTQDESFFDGLLAGTYTYFVTSADCSFQSDFVISQEEELIVEAITNDITCAGQNDGTIVVNVTGGRGPYFYSLFDINDNLIFVFAENELDGTDTGTYTFEDLSENEYRLLVEDQFGCPEIVEELIINEPSPVDITFVGPPTPETCLGDSDGSITMSISGGTVGPDPANPVYYYDINTDDIDDFQQIPLPLDNWLISGLAGGEHVITIRDYNNSQDCETPVIVYIEPGVDLSGELIAGRDCPIIDPITGEVTTWEQYTVEFNLEGDFNDADLTFTLTADVVVPGSPGPIQDVDNERLFYVEPGTAYTGTVTYEPTGCVQEFKVESVEDYEHMQALRAVMTGNPSDPNEYQIFVDGGDGDKTFFVAILEDGLTPEQLSEAIDQLTDSDFVELEADIFTVRRTATYVLKAVDESGCEIIVAQDIFYINIRIPNYFTPGVDNPNTPDDDSFWYPRQITEINTQDPFFFENMEVKVFDRYGRLLAEFRGQQSRGGWDGYYQGNPMPSGDYWFSVVLNDAESKEFTGHFTLYR